MRTIALEIDSSFSDELEAICGESGDAVVAQSRNFNGDAILHLVVGVAPPLIWALRPIVIAAIESKRHVVIKVDGKEFRGLSAGDAVKLLEAMSKDD